MERLWGGCLVGVLHQRREVVGGRVFGIAALALLEADMDGDGLE